MVALIRLYSRLFAGVVALVVAVLGVLSGVALHIVVAKCVVSFLVCLWCTHVLGMILGRMILRRVLEDRGLEQE